MKQIIDGLTYNTETATDICDLGSVTEYSSDFQWWRATLYVTKKGRFFMEGRGGPNSPFARSVGQNERQGGEGIIPLSAEEALAYAEQCADADTIAQHFADYIDEA